MLTELLRKKNGGTIVKKQLSLVELATHGYDSARVNKGSWLEQTFGKKNREVENNECARRPDQNKDE